MSEPIKLGFIGGGPRSQSLWRHLDHRDFKGKISHSAMLDPQESVRKKWVKKVEVVCSSLDQLLKTDVNAVIIASPPKTHAPIATRCLEAGVDVWSEVPMGLSMSELWGVIDAEKSNKGKSGRYSLGENYCYRLQPQFIAMKNQENAFGDIYYAEGEYTHSVEHYMIQENYSSARTFEVDPELTESVTPTWRADFNPIMYGHALGPCLYYLNRNSKHEIERPVSVSCMGNRKMQKRFNTDNFQIAMVQTNQETIVKFVIGFVLGHHGRIFYSAWGSGGIFQGASFQTKYHHFKSVPKQKRQYPDRLKGFSRKLSDRVLIKQGTPHAKGGHGGADHLMFDAWLNSLTNKVPMDIDVFRSAEMTAPGIFAMEAEEQKKTIDIPKFV